MVLWSTLLAVLLGPASASASASMAPARPLILSREVQLRPDDAAAPVIVRCTRGRGECSGTLRLAGRTVWAERYDIAIPAGRTTTIELDVSSTRVDREGATVTFGRARARVVVRGPTQGARRAACERGKGLARTARLRVSRSGPYAIACLFDIGFRHEIRVARPASRIAVAGELVAYPTIYDIEEDGAFDIHELRVFDVRRDRVVTRVDLPDAAVSGVDATALRADGTVAWVTCPAVRCRAGLERRLWLASRGEQPVSEVARGVGLERLTVRFDEAGVLRWHQDGAERSFRPRAGRAAP